MDFVQDQVLLFSSPYVPTISVKEIPQQHVDNLCKKGVHFKLILVDEWTFLVNIWLKKQHQLTFSRQAVRTLGDQVKQLKDFEAKNENQDALAMVCCCHLK